MVTAAAANLVPGARPELWGGLECSITRIRERYCDQLARAGHYERADDLRRIRDLGIRVLRYPILWERHAQPDDWSRTDERMALLRSLGFDLIIGLVHHGSGPPHTSLLEGSFADGLAEHAAQVAVRYPWVNRFTPVNEPLTTARFSALYGHWHPHQADAAPFIRAVLVQCRAIRAAMCAIRNVNPRAALVQTEDIAYTFSTPSLAYQAEFDNTRRWLSLDLLCGRFHPEHPLWEFVRFHGATQQELESFLNDPCPPEIIGINYYVTSERFLDERLALYPQATHGGNGRDAYADEAAVRVCAGGFRGPYGIYRETWERYGLPIAVTEAHLGCTREEQLRWFLEIWSAAERLAAEGADLRAVTSWSLFGAFDWNTLLTRDTGFYESGAFDLRAPRPRPTAIARCLAALASQRKYHHPVALGEGWWRRENRFICPPIEPANPSPETLCGYHPHAHGGGVQPILITGATGTLGRAFARVCEARGLEHRLLARRELDIADAHCVERTLQDLNPWVVINTAGFVRVDAAETESSACFRENTTGPANLASACAARELPFLTFSTDLVFDGRKHDPYLESDAPAPLNVYGRSKLQAERMVLERHAAALVVRTSTFFGPWDEFNFAHHVRKQLLLGRIFEAPCDAVVSPTYVPDLVHACLDLLIDGESGIWHLANHGTITWFDFARSIAALTGVPEQLVCGKPLKDFGWPAPRPIFSPLSSERAWVMPTLDDALGRYVSEACAFEVVSPARS